MKTLIALCLLVVSSAAGAASAQTAPAAAAGSDCTPLSSDKQLIRKGADRSILLRNGTDHYIVQFQRSCSDASVSRKLAFSTPDNEGQLCGAGASKLRTDTGSCIVEALEPISAESFASRARR